MLISFTASAQVNLNDLTEKGGKWYKRGESNAYTGDFVETNKKGAVTGTGSFVEGLADGLRIAYFDNGNKSLERYYTAGVMNGMAREYYENGTLKQECMVVDGENEGKAVVYYDTGGVLVEMNFVDGVQQGDYFEYAPDGKLLRQFWFVDNVAGYSPAFVKLCDEALELSRRFENEAAILKYDQAIGLNPTVAETYFNRGATKSSNFDFEAAILDYNIAIELNPDYMEAYANRANAKINKWTSKGILEPNEEQLDGACEDLDRALALGADKYMIEDKKFAYCDCIKKKNKKKKAR